VKKMRPIALFVLAALAALPLSADDPQPPGAGDGGEIVIEGTNRSLSLYRDEAAGRIEQSILRAAKFLRDTQAPDGSWISPQLAASPRQSRQRSFGRGQQPGPHGIALLFSLAAKPHHQPGARLPGPQ